MKELKEIKAYLPVSVDEKDLPKVGTEVIIIATHELHNVYEEQLREGYIKSDFIDNSQPYLQPNENLYIYDKILGYLKEQTGYFLTREELVAELGKAFNDGLDNGMNIATGKKGRFHSTTEYVNSLGL